MAALEERMIYFGLSIRKILMFRLVTSVKKWKHFLIHTIPNRKALARTKRLRGSHHGDSMFVFANGPSVGLLDPAKINALRKERFYIMGVNSYISSEFGHMVPPDFYVLSDPAHFGLDLQQIPDKRKSELKMDIERLRERNVQLFAPVSLYRHLTYEPMFPFNDSEDFFSSNVGDILKSRGYLSMTAYKALAVACYLGFSRIYICGFDNNYFKTLAVDEQNQMYYQNTHFYKKEIPDLHRTGESEGKSVGELLYNHHFLFKHLERFKRFPIVNLDKNGLVDAFPKNHSLDIYKG